MVTPVYNFLSSSISIPQPCPPFLLFLLPALLLERLQLLFTQLLATSLCPQTPPVVTVRSSIDVEERIHLPLALVLVVELFGVQICRLPSSGEAIEGSCRSICLCWVKGGRLVTKGVNTTSRLVDLCVVGIRVIVTVYCRVVAASNR